MDTQGLLHVPPGSVTRGQVRTDAFRETLAARGPVHFPSEKDRSAAEGRELPGPGRPKTLCAKEAEPHVLTFGSLVFKTSQLGFGSK